MTTAAERAYADAMSTLARYRKNHSRDEKALEIGKIWMEELKEKHSKQTDPDKTDLWSNRISILEVQLTDLTHKLTMWKDRIRELTDTYVPRVYQYNP